MEQQLAEAPRLETAQEREQRLKLEKEYREFGDVGVNFTLTRLHPDYTYLTVTHQSHDGERETQNTTFQPAKCENTTSIMKLKSTTTVTLESERKGVTYRSQKAESILCQQLAIERRQLHEKVTTINKTQDSSRKVSNMQGASKQRRQNQSFEGETETVSMKRGLLTQPEYAGRRPILSNRRQIRIET